jgi:hypothetical protein
MRDKISKGSLGCPLLAFIISTGAYSQKLPDKPNILIIMTDQQSAESLSFNLGRKYLNTPNLDKPEPKRGKAVRSIHGSINNKIQ